MHFSGYCQQYCHLHIDVHVLSIRFHKLVHSVTLCWLINRWSCLSEGSMHESRTRLCCCCCLALARGVRRVVMKRSSNRMSFAFHLGRKTLSKQWRQDNHVISLTKFASSKKPQRPMIDVFSYFIGVVWTELKLLNFKYPVARLEFNLHLLLWFLFMSSRVSSEILEGLKCLCFV